MKILIVGGTGTIGSAIVNELSSRHTLVTAGHSHGDIQVDMTDRDSIVNMYEQVPDLDAVVVAAGAVKFADFNQMNESDFQIGLQSKLMGQVNIVLIGRKYVNEKGSFTLTSGIINRDPIRTGVSAALVNSALEGFVKGAAIEMPKGQRINVVSPNVILESMNKYAPYFRGFKATPAADVAMAYSKSVEGHQTGQVYV